MTIPLVEKHKLHSLEAGRGVAALGVTIFHSAEAYPGDPPELLQRFYLSGQTGIYFFFVLSGFVIFYAHQKDIGNPDRLKRYAVKRINRIYPIYWFVLLAIMPIYFIFPSLGLPEFREWPTILSALLLFGDISPTPLTVAWTLFHEILFYIIFSAIIFSRTLGLSVLILWFSACLANTWIDNPSYIVSPLNLLFAFGLIASWVFSRRLLPFPSILVLGGVSIYISAVLVQPLIRNDGAGALIFGFGSAMIVLGGAQLDAAKRLKIPPALITLGAISYVLYLIHGPVISLVSKVLSRLDLDTFHFAATCATVLAAKFSALLAQRHIEEPLLRFGERQVSLRFESSSKTTRSRQNK